MARNKRISKVQKNKITTQYPELFIDKDSDFASIKIAPGIEQKSYEKDGFIFCENAKGQIIEIQVLNLSSLAKKAA